MAEKTTIDYTSIARHFDIDTIPAILERNLPGIPVSFADYGCGDGPFFQILFSRGILGPEKPVYAVDLQQERLDRITSRFKSIIPICRSVMHANEIPDGQLDLLISTMVLEHVENETGFIEELYRVLRFGGIAYLTTVFKKPWAWYFRKRHGKSVLDTSHIREYTDIESFRKLVNLEGRFSILDLQLHGLYFPLLDPILFRLFRKSLSRGFSGLIRCLRFIKIPIPGYYTMSVVIQKREIQTK